ncbi:hypothetical protein [Halorarius halobius]|uniref:hypothetical protein n=1 Tax=Halorarius halobius TaxID=2962671 RepID=UPI0020CBD9DF|nr:hypothetical protein [Halorarius halobius]
MDCLACGLRSGYNRVVVDLLAGTELGGLCFRCEERLFGRSLKDGLWTERSGCVLCSRDGAVALPEWRPRTSDTGGVLRLENDYELGATTVELCDEHFDRLENRSLDARWPDRTGDTNHVR